MTTWIAGASAVAAFASLAVAYTTQRSAREVALVQVHLALRTRFLEIYRQLPLADDCSPADGNASQAYWHNAYDEWFITTQLTTQFKKLWTDFYSTAIAAGFQHDVLEAELAFLLQQQEGFATYAGKFVDELETMVHRNLRPR
jgi:hypothetical protein